MAFNITKEIQKKNREQWQNIAHEKLTDSRIWIQENGEQAAIGALLLGFLIAYFFKLFVGILALVVIIATSIYLLAPAEDEATDVQIAGTQAEKRDDDNNSHVTKDSSDKENESPEASKSADGQINGAAQN